MRRAESAHNDYLQILAELGLPGLALALWGVGALGLVARRALRRAAGEPEAGLRLGAAGAVAGLAAYAFIDSPLHVPGLLVPGAALAGLLAAGAAPPAPTRPRWLDALPLRLRQASLVVLGLLAAGGVAAHGLAYIAAERGAQLRAARGAAFALPWLARAETLAPGSANYAEAHAAALVADWRRSGDAAQIVAAERAMLRAVALDPGDAERRARLARLYRDLVPADPEVARRALERADRVYAQAERLDPYAVRLPFERAGILLRLGDAERAVAALRRAVALEPTFLPARLELARRFAAAGRVEEAAGEYRTINATLAAYSARRLPQADVSLAREFLAVDAAAVRREAAALGRKS
jgi:tetratricopeptide (TPR) repeat protein